MKRLSLLFILLQISPWAMAQILNGDFESWENYIYYQDPTGWFTNNAATSKLGVLTVLRDDSIVYGGRYSADLISQKLPLGGTLAGFIFLGSSLNPDLGIPFNQRPTSFSAWFQYIPKTKDTCIFRVTLTRRNPVTHVRDTVATTTFYNGTTFRVYSNFISSFIYYQTEDPDTMHIYISSSALPAPPPGSILRVDNLTLNGLTGIQPVSPAIAFGYYPNPVKDRLNIIMGSTLNAVCIKLFDSNGTLKDRQFIHGKTISMDISSLPAGIYFFELIGMDGTVLKADRFEKIN